MPAVPSQVLWSEPESARRGRPLLVVLHGHGMDERMGFDLRHRLPSSLVVASLRGPRRARGGYGWFALDHTFEVQQVDSAVDSVLGWLDEQAGHGWVGVLGFSQGSAIALQCLRSRPSGFACAVILSGFVSPLPASGDRELAQRRPPVFSGRGDSDPLVPAILVQATDRWLSTHTTLTRKVYPGLGHTVSLDELDDLALFLRTHLE
jgi:phospholipase/carboxylesterase